MRVYYCDHHVIDLPDRHPFPMHKYRELREALLRERVLTPQELIPAEPASVAALKAVHSARYVDGFLAGRLEPGAQKRIGFPWSEALVRRTLASVGGTLAAAEAAFEDGIAGNLAGGTHHAHAAFGSGYCVFNDVAVAARSLLDRERVGRLLVFDVDVHQGDGTASIFADEPRVFTASIHGEKNFPLRKQTSDLDVALPDDAGDREYLAAVDETLERCLRLAEPEIVFVQGGVDALDADHLGRLSVSGEGLAERDARVLGALRERGLPAVLTLGGGYSRPIEATIAAHVNTYRAAKALLG